MVPPAAWNQVGRGHNLIRERFIANNFRNFCYSYNISEKWTYEKSSPSLNSPQKEKALGIGIPRAATASIKASFRGKGTKVSRQRRGPSARRSLFIEQVRHYGDAAITCVVQARKFKSSFK